MKLLVVAILSTLFFISVYFHYYIDFTQLTLLKQGEKIESKTTTKEVEFETYEVTAYTAGAESTGKTPAHPAYGITASGTTVAENRTIACPPEIEFGTKVFIPHFNETFICEDRGGLIKGKTLDIYMEDVEDALQFGRRQLEVKIINE
ncbi:3D domain-containing protein [Bacillus sp. FJAT-45350]|uniref:3D domain-containing protein n=1 Tax=Bacillus sp. FJAT-45350 TaxID=2011014 RepID=UPI000BB71E39|nr:3D domain-containing protein [Bacillus sp. FJAT-45350]